MNPYHHAISSAKQFGGKAGDYQAIHDWFDETKAHFADFRHRALRHHSLGIFECEAKFGKVLVNSDGKEVPVRFIGEQHVKEDCGGKIPSVQDWLSRIQPEMWMSPRTDPKLRKSVRETTLVIGDGLTTK